MQNRASIILSFTIIMFYFAKPKSYSPLYLFLSFPFYAKIKRTQVTDRGKPPRFIYLKEGVIYYYRTPGCGSLSVTCLWSVVFSAEVKHLLYIRRKDRHIVAEIKFYIYRLTQIFVCFFSGYQTFWTRLAQYCLFSMQFIIVLTLFQYLIYTQSRMSRSFK